MQLATTECLLHKLHKFMSRQIELLWIIWTAQQWTVVVVDAFFFFFKCLMALLFFQLLLVHWNTSLGAHLDCSPPGDGFLQLPFFLQPILQDVCAKHLAAIVHINERNSHGRSYFDKKGKNSCCIPANVHFQHVLTPDNNFPCFSSHSRKWKWNEWV